MPGRALERNWVEFCVFSRNEAGFEALTDAWRAGETPELRLVALAAREAASVDPQGERRDHVSVSDEGRSEPEPVLPSMTSGVDVVKALFSAGKESANNEGVHASRY